MLACSASSGLWRCSRAGVRFLFLGRVRCRDVCGELTGTARMPIIGWRRFSFLCHLFRSLVISYSIPDDAVPITCSCRARCRMFSSCLTYSVVLPLLSSGETLGDVRASAACDYDGRADVMRRSCGGWLIGSLAPRPPTAPLPRHGWRGGERGVVVACFFRISTVRRSRRHVRLTMGLVCLLAPMSAVGFILRCAMRGFCGSRHCGCRGCFAMVYCHCVVREDEHGIGSSGFLSLVFLTRFPLRLTPTSSLVSTLIAATGIFNPFMPDCSWGRSFRRASPRPLTHGGRGEVFFYNYHLRRAG